MASPNELLSPKKFQIEEKPKHDLNKEVDTGMSQSMYVSKNFKFNSSTKRKFIQI